LEQHPVTSSVSAFPPICSGPTEQLVIGHNSLSLPKVFNSSPQCHDSAVPVSSAGAVKAAIDMASIFHLSQDDFNDDIDDLSFIDLTRHEQVPQGSTSLSVASDHQWTAAVACKNKSLTSKVSDIVSRNHCIQLPKNNVMKRCDVNTAALAQNENWCYTGSIDFPHKNGNIFKDVYLLLVIAKSLVNYVYMEE